MKRQRSLNQFFAKRSKVVDNGDSVSHLLNPIVESIENNLTLMPDMITVAPSTSAAHNNLQCEVCNDDFGLLIGKVSALTDEEKYNLLVNSKQPDSNYQFTYRTMANQNRSFQYKWLVKYNGLVYSKFLNGGFCKYCFLFGSNELGVLVTKPFTAFVKASEILKYHFGTNIKSGRQSHLQCYEKAINFISVIEGKQTSIARQIETARQSRLQNNKLILHNIIETLILCGKQNIALCGHRDDSRYHALRGHRDDSRHHALRGHRDDSRHHALRCHRDDSRHHALRGHRDDSRHHSDLYVNCGNFYTLLQFRIACGDNVLKNHIESGPKNQTYISKTTQNDIIDCIKSYIQEKILNEIREAKFFAISADEAADAANVEQLTVVIRYVDTNDNIRESFIQFFDVTGKTQGSDIAHILLSAVSEWNLDMQNCRAQTYDKAGNIAGIKQGCSTLINNKYPKALYFHCASHALNLCLNKGCEITLIRNITDSVGKIVRYFKFSPKRESYLMNYLKSEGHKHKIKDLCTTRFIERHDAFAIFAESYVHIVECLENIAASNDFNKESSSEAHSYSSLLTKFETIIALIIVKNIFIVTRGLSVSLQKVKLDIIEGYQQIVQLKLVCKMFVIMLINFIVYGIKKLQKFLHY